MSKIYYVMPEETISAIHPRATYKDRAESISFDFSPWVEDNASISTVDWTLESGQATIGTPSLAANVATSVITTSQAGRSLISIKATDTNGDIITQYLEIQTKDPSAPILTDDYGLRTA